MSKMLKSSGAMAAATLLSRVLGLVREMVYARFLGASAIKGTFDVAYMIPNLFRRMLGEGALSAAFLPIFKEREELDGDQAMWHTANAVISGLVVFASLISVVGMLGITALLNWADLSTQTGLMLGLLRIMAPYMMLVCLAATLMGMLNSRGFFFIPALGATLLNVVMIAAVLFFADRFGELPREQVYVLAWGTLVAGIAQAGFQIPTLYRNGFRYRWVNPWKNTDVKEVVRRMIPGVVGAAAFQINMLLTQGVAWFVGAHIVGAFNYSVRLMEFPQGIFGASLAAFILPTLAGLAAKKEYREMISTIHRGLGYAAFVNLYAIGMSIVLAKPVIRLLFEGGQFNAENTVAVSRALMCLAPSLLAYTTSNILTRAFYALGDVQTPMRISIACLTMNLVFVLFLIQPFEERGLGMANSMSAFINAGLLMHAMRIKLKGNIDFKPLLKTVGLMAVLAAVAAQLAWGVLVVLESAIEADHLGARLAKVFVPALIAAAGYGFAGWWLKLDAAKDVAALISHKLRGGGK